MTVRNSKEIYAGLFFVSLVTMMFEILICRVFSATVWYHFAFMAVSLSMFGMTVGALLVYLFPKFFSVEKTRHHLWLSTQSFAVFLVLSILLYTKLPVVLDLSLASAISLSLVYVLFSLPFVASGVAVCLALTRFPDDVDKMYASDLTGAALGCPGIVLLLGILDPISASLLMGVLLSLAGLMFAKNNATAQIKVASLATAFLLSCGFVAQTYLKATGQPALSFLINKAETSADTGNLEYEKWNAFSLIRVRGYSDKPFGWGLSTLLPESFKINQKWLNIDGSAATVITKWPDEPSKLDYLKYDITNFAHVIRPNSDVMVIGVGGGRDILSALTFGQKSVTGAEINNLILNMLQSQFADFSGNLGKNPKVNLVNDEARSFLAYSNRKFDVIQASLIDTWAASASGAYVLSENTLYTTDAWKNFLNHLTDRGILSFSRWYGWKARPDEYYRLVELAVESLRQIGVKEPRKHLLAVGSKNADSTSSIEDVVTLLVAKQPFSDDDVHRFEAEAKRLKFEVLLTPHTSIDEVVSNLAHSERNEKFLKEFPVNIEAPTDDNPFFFNLVRPEKIFGKDVWSGAQGAGQTNVGVFILDVLLLCVTLLTSLCIVVPLAFTAPIVKKRIALPLVGYFGCVGLAFMFVEIATMQRLGVMLGHPTYGLTVVMFSLLIGTGLGSYLSGLWKGGTPWQRNAAGIALLIIVLTALTASLSYWPRLFESAPLAVRVGCAVACVLPMGLVMGSAFPLGIKLAESLGQRKLMPWLWGINGATSVLASVLAIILSMVWGIQNTLFAGVGFYALALLILLTLRHQKAEE